MKRACVVLGALLAASAAAAPAAPAVSATALLDYLNQGVRWFRQQSALSALTTDPSDVMFAGPARQQAHDVIQLAFSFARALVALQPTEVSPQQPASGAGSQGRLNVSKLAAMSADAGAAAERAEAAVSQLQGRVGSASGAARRLLAGELAEAKSELALAEARRDALASYLAFVNQAGAGAAGAGGLLGQIDELQRSVPEAAADARAAAPAPASTPAAAARRAAPEGLVALTSELVSLGRKLARLREGQRLTTALRATSDQLRAPLVADLRATLKSGDEVSQAPDTKDRSQLEQRRRQLDELTAHFKKVSAAVAPLGKQAMLLDEHAATLGEWRATVGTQYAADLRALLLHLGLLAVAIAVVLAASSFWRRATLRYVQDARRRQQSLLLRRILVSLTLALVVAFAFVNELGSLATFAGFLTAGLAVALQNVILSVAAYFFLIGKFGIGVGDRVQIGSVTGDVIDIGLVRLHLMELRPDGLPTGRVVAFSNAVLFQPTSNFFKQLPGSNFAWHELTLTLASETDYHHAERLLLGAVEGVYAQYRERIARQHAAVAESLTIEMPEPRPESQLRLAASGVEMTIRFPVPLESASAVDDQVTRALLSTLEREPGLQLAGSARPTIRAAPQPVGT